MEGNFGNEGYLGPLLAPCSNESKIHIFHRSEAIFEEKCRARPCEGLKVEKYGKIHENFEKIIKF